MASYENKSKYIYHLLNISQLAYKPYFFCEICTLAIGTFSFASEKNLLFQLVWGIFSCGYIFEKKYHFLSRMAYKYIFEGFIKISVNCCNFVACFSIRCTLLLIILSKHSQQKTFQSQIEGEENIQKSTVMSSISKVMNDEDIKQENFGGEDSITLWLYFFQSYPMCIFICINFIISNFNFLPFV